MMNVGLWILQALLAIAFLAHGVMFLVPPPDIAALMNENLPRWFQLFLGVAEVAAAVGLIVPGLTRVMPSLISWAAAGIVVVMIGATLYHVVRNEISSAVITAIPAGDGGLRGLRTLAAAADRAQGGGGPDGDGVMMLQPRDAVPHFSVPTVDGRLVRYDDVWQRQFLVLVCVPEENEAARAYASDLVAACRATEVETAAIVTAVPVDSVARPGALVADRYGEIAFVTGASPATTLPAPEELADWVRYIGIRCS